MLDGLPVPLESSSLPLTERIRALTARLATPDDRFAEWASHFGLEPKTLEPDAKDDLIADLDAAVSLLYGLSDRDVRHIFETADFTPCRTPISLDVGQSFHSMSDRYFTDVGHRLS